ncbi:hypothetical protein AKO1_014357 [Acrasis kona]|uniref:Uncharacterized protein n=1 Tax=Acrasis kona TaxID=1008807 RepID=A0AAW2Z0X6_9EUKA
MKTCASLVLLLLITVAHAGDFMPKIEKTTVIKREFWDPKISASILFAKSVKTETEFGPADNKIHSNFFIGRGYKLGVSCRIDCLSTVGGKPFFTQCASRYYYYAKGGEKCLQASDLNEAQAAKVEDYCVNECKCRKLNKGRLTAGHVRVARGDNSGREPM